MASQRLTEFVGGIRQILDESNGNEQHILAKAEPLLRDLVSNDDWLEEKYTRPHPEYYQQYCLYACPKGDFSVVSFVWGPGQKTPVHDHTVWGVIGMLRGAEIAERFTFHDNGALLPAGREELLPGMTDCVSPSIGDIHRVSNSYNDRVSISIHLYGADIGKVNRHVFVPETGEVKNFVSGYAQPVE
ncbi:MAG: cysteine dioxygenase [Burkholderiaceae bacterium]|jgi:predicted metal-dependent enzyme (double-stranded beta helix superfamily)